MSLFSMLPLLCTFVGTTTNDYCYLKTSGKTRRCFVKVCHPATTSRTTEVVVDNKHELYPLVEHLFFSRTSRNHSQSYVLISLKH